MCIKGYSQKSEKTTQRQPNPKKISANHISDKSLVSRIRKKLAAQQEKKTVQQFLNVFKELQYDPAIPLQGIYPKKLKTRVQTKIYTQMFTLACFTTA